VLQRLLNYSNAAEVLYGVGPSRTSDAGGRDADHQPEKHLARGVTHLLMQLINNLETKSRQYKEQALASLFMMNNVHYVQWSVENSNALALLGQEWLERHKDLVEDFGAKYHDVVWMPLVAMLQVRGAPRMSFTSGCVGWLSQSLCRSLAISVAAALFLAPMAWSCLGNYLLVWLPRGCRCFRSGLRHQG
jgi:hypothetical protein